jgi:hypothetical protein
VAFWIDKKNKKRIGMCSIVNQSTARKSDQSEVTISGRLANQNPGKRTNQKAGYQKKQSIDSIDTKSSFYKKTRDKRYDSYQRWCQLIITTMESLVQCYTSGGRFDQSSERRRTRELEI